jgi:hypothetical protein
MVVITGRLHARHWRSEKVVSYDKHIIILDSKFLIPYLFDTKLPIYKSQRKDQIVRRREERNLAKSA